jgi:hypothetical protein
MAVLRELGDGLIIRCSDPADAQALADFNVGIHAENDIEKIALADWTLDLISGKGPSFGTGDFTIVEDTASGEIVSSCCLISQTWAYEDVPFGVGRPELVATKPDYRRRGLVREQFEILHAWSAARGELVQVITGIPYYYRQFGYEMALNVSGGRAGYELQVPKLKEGEKEPYTLRLATEADIPFLVMLYEHGCRRDMVSAVWDEALWRYEISGKRQMNINRRDIYIIQAESGKRAGFIAIPPVKWGNSSMATQYELTSGFDWSAVTPSVIRWLWQKGEALAEEQDLTQAAFGFWLGESHPVYAVISDRLPRKSPPYAFYVRVPDLCAFIQTISPVLERRLKKTAFSYYTGTVKLNFYRDGLEMNLENGQITSVKPLGFDELKSPTASFPPLVFNHLLFGHRSMQELDDAYADCSTKQEMQGALLDALFPKKPSNVWPIS